MNITQAKSINQLAARLIIEELVRLGCVNFFISPGSRSTPLTLAAAENKKAATLVHFDERSQAFAALGCARATGKPSVLICTSGTAGVNYYPAVVEASSDRIPLIVLTADRPPELQNINSNQTIDQQQLYGKFVRRFENINPPDKNTDFNKLLNKIDTAYQTAVIDNPGPVHLNLMFREPLVPLGKNKSYRSILKPLDEWLKSNQPLTTHPSNKNNSISDFDEIAKVLNKKDANFLVIAGYQKNQNDIRAISKLCQKYNYPLIADIRSGLRLHQSSENQISYYDLLMLDFKNRFNQPLTVLHFGGNLTSKRLLKYIEQAGIDKYIHIDTDDYAYNPHHRTTDHFQLNISSLCNKLIKANLPSAKTNSFAKRNITSCKKIKTLIENFCSHENLSEISIARIISENIKNNSHLFLGSSMPIRDFDSFADVTNKNISIFANRGASGIDGSIASFCGILSADNKPGTALIGDLAFLHDLNSLALLNKINKSAVLIVINNNGGGIFSFLPVAKTAESFEQYFGTPHGLSFEKAASLFRLAYTQPKTKEEFIQSYNTGQQSGQPLLIEIITNRDKNYKEHKKLFSEIKRIIR